MALLALIPGCEQVVQVSGRAEITSDETMKQAFAVQGNAPKLVTRAATSIPGAMKKGLAYDYKKNLY